MDIQQLKQLKILVIGDYCIDVFKYGTCSRLSPEAPVPVLLFKYETKTDGMAGNVYNNLLALNVQTELITSTKQTIKERFIDLKSKQHILRLDTETQIQPISLDKLLFLSDYDSIIISDYEKGSITKEVVEYIKNNFSGPIFVDTKKNDLSLFSGCIVKINENEFQKAINISADLDLIVTVGQDGAFYKNKNYPTKKVTVFDVSGAGDSFIAALAVQYALKKDIECAIKFANVCASSVVKKTGTAIIDFEEVKNDLCF
jgi:D-beta-D-heptose 7-phosphate kinase/D-beta-D-heptose 1-phosphate adenosyltransferase